MKTLFVVLLLLSQLALAQGKKRTAISFEDELVTGDLKSPDIEHIMRGREVNFGQLIDLREHFKPELRRTAEDIK